MLEVKNCTIIAELMKKSKKTIQTWLSFLNEEGLEGMVLNLLLDGHPILLIND
ncbi:MAG: hypothetical protein GF311_12530 [Candidatus Lokiarchaeota archaeon]|nr:hypothetical protein [Candidatus Lokiarchaeota archaeon]